MRRETIEMSYFGKCGFCSEIIVAERDIAELGAPVVRGMPDPRFLSMNDNSLALELSTRIRSYHPRRPQTH